MKGMMKINQRKRERRGERLTKVREMVAGMISMKQGGRKREKRGTDKENEPRKEEEGKLDK